LQNRCALGWSVKCARNFTAQTRNIIPVLCCIGCTACGFPTPNAACGTCGPQRYMAQQPGYQPEQLQPQHFFQHAEGGGGGGGGANDVFATRVTPQRQTSSSSSSSLLSAIFRTSAQPSSATSAVPSVRKPASAPTATEQRSVMSAPAPDDYG
jgi:hypothetical protein